MEPALFTLSTCPHLQLGKHVQGQTVNLLLSSLFWLSLENTKLCTLGSQALGLRAYESVRVWHERRTGSSCDPLPLDWPHFPGQYLRSCMWPEDCLALLLWSKMTNATQCPAIEAPLHPWNVLVWR